MQLKLGLDVIVTVIFPFILSGGAVVYYPKGSGLNFYSDYYTQKSGQKNNNSKIQRFLVKTLLSKT